MVNLTVINKKDITKYLVKIIIVCIVLLIITRYFFCGKEEKANI